jgi:hypothetical protein
MIGTACLIKVPRNTTIQTVKTRLPTQLASQGPNRAAARVRDVTSDPRRRAAVFSNDNYTQTFVARKPQMTQQMLEVS